MTYAQKLAEIVAILEFLDEDDLDRIASDALALRSERYACSRCGGRGSLSDREAQARNRWRTPEDRAPESYHDFSCPDCEESGVVMPPTAPTELANLWANQAMDRVRRALGSIPPDAWTLREIEEAVRC